MSIPGVSFCLPAHPGIHRLSTYISDPSHAGKQKIGAYFSSSGWCCIKTVKNCFDANGKREFGGQDAASNRKKMKLMPTKIKKNWSVLLASGKNSALMMQHFSKAAQSSSLECFKKIQHSMVRAKNHRHDYPIILRINERRHGKLQKTSSCLQSSFDFWNTRSLRTPHERGDQNEQTSTDCMGGWLNCYKRAVIRAAIMLWNNWMFLTHAYKRAMM